MHNIDNILLKDIIPIGYTLESYSVGMDVVKGNDTGIITLNVKKVDTSVKRMKLSDVVEFSVVGEDGEKIYQGERYWRVYKDNEGKYAKTWGTLGKTPPDSNFKIFKSDKAADLWISSQKTEKT